MPTNRRLINCLIWLSLCHQLTSAQVITTVAGTDFVFPRHPINGLAAPLGAVQDLASDPQGNIYASDPDNGIIVRLAPDGILTVFAGNGIHGYTGDGGQAVNASLDAPNGLALDPQGNLYFLDHQRIRKITSQGVISTISGTGNIDFNCAASAPAKTTSFGLVDHLAADSAGAIYFIDRNCSMLFRITADGQRKLILDGVGGRGTLAVDAAGNIFLSKSGSFQKLSPNGVFTPLIGLDPAGVVIDRNGGLYLSDLLGNRIFRNNNTDNRGNSLVAGNGPAGGGVFGVAPVQFGFLAGDYSGDGGPALNAGLRGPAGLALDPSGALFFADSFNHRIRKISSSGIISTVAGNGRYGYSGDGGLATNATFNYVTGIAVDPAGNLFIADAGANVVRRISVSGEVSTYAGTGEPGFGGDGGPATQAKLAIPVAVALDSAGNLFIADALNNRVRRVTPFGTITTFAGRDEFDTSGLTLATRTSFSHTTALAVEASGSVLLAAGTQLFRITPLGGVTLVAGTLGAGFGGDNVPATSVGLGAIYAITSSPSGDIYISSTSNPIFRVTPAGTLFRVPNAPGQSLGITPDSKGNLVFAASAAHLVHSLDANGSLTRIAGGGATRFEGGFSGDGDLALKARLNTPWGVASDRSGNLYIADNSNHRIRKILAAPPSFTTGSAPLSFAGRSGGTPAAAQLISASGSVPGILFTASVTGGNWLAVNPSSGETPRLLEVTADPADLAPGTYLASIRLSAPNAVPQQRTIDVKFTVGDSLPPGITIDKDSLSFNFPRTPVERSQTIKISNSGSGRLPFSATAVTASGGSWLKVSPLTGEATPRSPIVLSVTANSTGLIPGSYTGAVAISADAESKSVPVTLTVSSRDQAIFLSQAGLSFTAVAGGGVVPPQSFAVLNPGTGVMPWQASVSTHTGTDEWISISPGQGSTDASSSAVPSVAVSVNQAGLPPGHYYALVRVDSPAAANTPQVVTVFLQVQTPDSRPGSVIQPTELVFPATAGALSPGSQDVLIYNLNPSDIQFRSSVFSSAGSYRILYQPIDATIHPQQPARITLQPITDGLPPGDYPGELTLQFDDGSVRRLGVLLSISGASAAPSKNSTLQTDSACVASKLLPAFVTLGQTAIASGWPAGVVVNIKDNCQLPMSEGSVVISFSNGNAPLSLSSLKDGRWEGTWQSGATPGVSVVVKVEAADTQRGLRGQSEFRTGLENQLQTPPTFISSSVRSAAGLQPNVALGPGGMISIFGDLLTSGAAGKAEETPLTDRLNGTQVIMAGRTLPLLYAAPNQINAIVPYDMEPNTTHQMLVRRSDAYSLPVKVNVATSQPASFTYDGRRAIIEAVRGNSRFLVALEKPARAGDVIVIYGAGLGPVTTPLKAGAASPANPLAHTSDTVTLMIGGISAAVSFAGLTPGSTGLYQVNATVPEGIAKGSDVSVVLQVSGQISPIATIAIE
ncbi:MAG: hypothetical protein JJE04_16645 [Acidobacteriia bacterium]|nr:hypothetical protein [Terriglobia bacterium]